MPRRVTWPGALHSLIAFAALQANFGRLASLHPEARQEVFRARRLQGQSLEELRGHLKEAQRIPFCVHHLEAHCHQRMK